MEEKKMRRAMVFIDGTWLWHNMMSQKEKLDLKKLPKVIISRLSEELGYPLDLKGIIFCASLPDNVSACDYKVVSKRDNFFSMLEKKCDYTLEIFKINFRGHRVRKADRNKADSWEPAEKCVDIAVASNILYHAALDNYDHAIVITGDRDFSPAFNKAIDLGKSITIASFRESCSQQLFTNYNVIFIDDFLDEITLQPESSTHTSLP